MRYASQVDQVRFQASATSAAEAALAGEAATAREHLGQCYDALAESRKFYYPVDAYLIDLTLVAESTLGAPLHRALAGPSSINLLLQAGLVQKIAAHEPALLASLREAIAVGRACLVGGELREGPAPLRPIEHVLADLAAALSVYEQALGRRPTIYGRRTHGLFPGLPQILSRLGYRAALHFTLDDGHFPLGEQIKGQWEGADGTLIDALLRLPRDASRPETFVELGKKLGESMDGDHVATLVFAHWPGHESPWYEDLRRIGRASSVLGKWVTLDDYFATTPNSGRTSRLLADDYRAPYLAQAVAAREANPITCIAREHGERARCACNESLATMAAARCPQPHPHPQGEGD
jgi:alpha-mannosidase